jgi:fatty acid desaturase
LSTTSLNAASDAGAAWWSRAALGTWLVVAGVYGGFGLLTWHYHDLPWWVIAPLGGYIVCLHGSLQHEAVHGRPTGIRWLEALIVFPSLWLYLPFAHYKDSHLRHHQDQDLTDPLLDPESNYLTPEQWAAMGPARRAFHRTLRTLAGRLILGPVRSVLLTWAGDFPRLIAGDARMLRLWLPHVPAVAVVLWWVIVVCDVPLWGYVLYFVYPGISLTLLRSFAEHRPMAEVDQRTAIVEAGLITRILFLANNYHALHHRDPWRPWYELGAVYGREREALLAANGGCVYRGYREIARRWLFAVRDGPVHPSWPFKP